MCEGTVIFKIGLSTIALITLWPGKDSLGSGAYQIVTT